MRRSAKEIVKNKFDDAKRDEYDSRGNEDVKGFGNSCCYLL